MPKLMIFNREEEYIGDVKDIIQASQKLEISGEDSLTIETLDNRLEKGYRILYHDRDADKFYEYIIQEKEEYKSGKTIVIDIYADNSISELIGDYIEDRRSINEFASHAIERALEGTRWQMGRFYNGWRGTVTFYRTNARAAIAAIMDEWQLEMETEIEFNKESGKIKRTLHLVYERGQFRNSKLTYTRDIVDIKRKTLPRDIITALYGYGKGEQTASGGYTRRINFSDINNGKAYVENNEAKELWGRVGDDGNKIHTFAKIEFESIEDKSLLLERTQSELDKLSKPAVSYEVSILDFFRLSKSKHKYIELGDTVRVIDRDFVPQISFSMRVVDIVRDLVNIENTRIILGETVKNIADRESEQDKILDDMNSEEFSYDDWDDDWDDDGGWGDDTTYYNPSQLVKAIPSLRIGRVSWVDISNPDSVDYNSKGKVLNVRDHFTEEVIYTQDEVDKRPTLKNMDGRRWLSFNPDPMVMQRWRSGSDVPDDLIKQNGQYLINEKPDEPAVTILIAYHDRTPEPISDYQTNRLTANIGFPVGGSSPLGYPYGQTAYSRHGGLVSQTSRGVDIIFYAQSGRNVGGRTDRVRDENVVAILNNRSYERFQTFNSLGMNKESYDGIRSASGYRRDWIYNINTFFTGEIAEVVVYSRELDTNEIDSIEDYMSNKYSSHTTLKLLRT